jgi:hypothetical protein
MISKIMQRPSSDYCEATVVYSVVLFLQLQEETEERQEQS